MTASDLFEFSSSPNAQFWPACADCLPVDVIDFDLGGVEMVPDGGKGLCLGKSSSVDDRDEDDEEVKYGDSTVNFAEPFYFAMAPATSHSRKYGSMESRHNIAFMASDSRLMSM